jgi:hypothetical protein
MSKSRKKTATSIRQKRLRIGRNSNFECQRQEQFLPLLLPSVGPLHCPRGYGPTSASWLRREILLTSFNTPGMAHIRKKNGDVRITWLKPINILQPLWNVSVCKDQRFQNAVTNTFWVIGEMNVINSNNIAQLQIPAFDASKECFHSANRRFGIADAFRS